jgi:putative toxin-antitoxin system antitoxin component (TIGR02293 family)
VIEAARVAEILGVRANTVRDLTRNVEEGLGKGSLVRVARRVAARGDEADRLMYRVVAKRAFERRARLNQHESEVTERLARVIASAEYAWDDRKDARDWLTAPHPELDGKPPIEAALTELGARRVEAVLDKILYGLPA